MTQRKDTEDEMAGWHHWLDGHESQWTPMDREAWRAAIHGVQRVIHDWATDLIWSNLNGFKMLNTMLSLWCWEGLGQEEKGTTEDEMAGWHHWLDGHESEWTPGVGDGQGGLACCNSWGREELDTTERLNWTELNTVLDTLQWLRAIRYLWLGSISFIKLFLNLLLPTEINHYVSVIKLLSLLALNLSSSYCLLCHAKAGTHISA